MLQFSEVRFSNKLHFAESAKFIPPAFYLSSNQTPLTSRVSQRHWRQSVKKNSRVFVKNFPLFEATVRSKFGKFRKHDYFLAKYPKP
ncbi:hypothetical protein [Capnocytophaga cynodegmi]|uniref:hypothetical protein n=1 Tax=Capnocytophaga cynodegmi TaxID=28189 RepID=UPI00385E16D6